MRWPSKKLNSWCIKAIPAIPAQFHQACCSRERTRLKRSASREENADAERLYYNYNYNETYCSSPKQQCLTPTTRTTDMEPLAPIQSVFCLPKVETKQPELCAYCSTPKLQYSTLVLQQHLSSPSLLQQVTYTVDSNHILQPEIAYHIVCKSNFWGAIDRKHDLYFIWKSRQDGLYYYAAQRCC